MGRETIIIVRVEEEQIRGEQIIVGVYLLKTLLDGFVFTIMNHDDKRVAIS